MRTIHSSWNKVEVSKEYSDAVYELWTDNSASVLEKFEIDAPDDALDTQPLLTLELITYVAPDDTGAQKWAVVIDDTSSVEIDESDDEPSARANYERNLREQRD